MLKTFEFVKYIFITTFNGVLQVAIITTWLLIFNFIKIIKSIKKTFITLKVFNYDSMKKRKCN